ncbi:helix-turn-helix domain-containing protein [uncultured Methylobacterium sp.]|uniref:helix-turn-helix domain-containing protein n=1 Tax=uncultured Methylobacterium sp. TaxID=157278 RepID=UPI0035CBDF5B
MAEGVSDAPQPRKRRHLPGVVRERQIVEAATRFFAGHGFEGQTRERAKRVGITHSAIFRDIPTTEALIERVYHEVFVSRWNLDWDALIRDRTRPLEERLVQFYREPAVADPHAVAPRQPGAHRPSALGGDAGGRERHRPDPTGPRDGGEPHQAHPAQIARDSPGPDAPAPAPLDRVVQLHGAARHEGRDEPPEQDAGPGTRTPCGPARPADAVRAHVHLAEDLLNQSPVGRRVGDRRPVSREARSLLRSESQRSR